MKRGEFEKAVEKYRECIALKPTECSIYTNRYELTANSLIRPCVSGFAVVFLLSHGKKLASGTE